MAEEYEKKCIKEGVVFEKPVKQDSTTSKVETVKHLSNHGVLREVEFATTKI